MRILAPKFRIVLISLVLALPMSGVAAVGAQEQEFTPDAYASQLTGFDIEVAGPLYAITSATLEHYGNGEGEIITIESDVVSIEVSFFDDADTPEQTIDAYLAGIENADLDYTLIDRGISADVNYALTSIHNEGIDVLYYMQVTEDVTGNVDLFETILAAADAFDDDLAAAQNEVTIDSAPFMETANGPDLVARATAGVSTPGAAPEASAPATSVTFDNAGVELGISDEFEILGDPVVDGSIQGYVVTGAGTVSLVAVGETGLTAEETVQNFADSLDGTYDSVEQIDASASIDSAWSLHRVEDGGQTFIFLISVDTAMVPGFEVLVGTEMPATGVAASIASVQTGLSVDGQPLLVNIDADDIAGRVGEEISEPTIEAVETPEATAADDTNTGRPRDDAKLPSDAGTGNTSEINGTPEATEEPVTQSDSSWEGPVLGHVVEWDAATWFVDVDDASMVESDEEEQYESITLTAEFSPIVSLMYVDMYGVNDSTPEEYLAYWSSDEFLRHETSSGEQFIGELVSTRSRDGRVAVIISYTNSDGDFFLIREAVATGDGSIMLLTLDVPATDVVPAYTSVQDGVTVDSGPAFSVFTQNQIERATAD